MTLRHMGMNELSYSHPLSNIGEIHSNPQNLFTPIQTKVYDPRDIRIKPKLRDGKTAFR